MSGSPFGAPFGSGQASDGDDCSACDGTGHVCADDGTATFPAGSHGSRLHPWDGVSDRADACDHGGGAPCPACMIPPGSDVEPLEVVDARPAPTGLDRIREAVRRDRGQVTGAELAAELAALRAQLIADGHLPRLVVAEPDRRPWWRRSAGRLAAAFAARLPTWR